ncbi:ATP-dependent DNA helicase [Paeniroseomonas aquatica]|uniref:ATP-dependent DNA helicase n=1 Tax=Paeniroseomonas aquatica TaxID=373043 RepID=A0ABT8A842_9PROT|nr:ATP-dependent DNA helicase [Paeniroseomonas aquatica]MDN3565833.1 ATP-dependent DNA helicase [Paeniroseomonas aquatica]
MSQSRPAPPRLLLPDAPALIAGLGRATLLTPDGELLEIPARELARHLAGTPPLLVHGPATARRLDLPPFDAAFDLLELFAFCMPGRPAAPTPRGLAMALDLPSPADDSAAAALLPEMATIMLRHLAAGRGLPLNRDAAMLAAQMDRVAGWPWAPSVIAALGGSAEAKASLDPYKVWRRLPDWEDPGPAQPAGSFDVSSADARARLAHILGDGAEQRPQQADYASAASGAFAPREDKGSPHVILAEAGTGTGKTLGYIAPASLWAERNGAPVWISTFTRNLQRQIDQELGRLYPDPEERRRRVVVRKGRENYLCLLNLEEMLGQASHPDMAVPLGLVARWALATKDGDLMAGDFPGWVTELYGPAAIWPLADRRGECIRSACPRYKQCFVEHSIRRARTATLVVANHALVMVQAAMGGAEDARPLRYVFDEGHHLFDAADAAFSAALCGAETAELRRWLLGAEGGRSRARGLRRRIEELASDLPEVLPPMEAALNAARALPGLGWVSRLSEEPREPTSEAAAERLANPTEVFLRAVRRQVLARAPEEDGVYDVQCDLFPLGEDLPDAAEALERAMKRIAEPLVSLCDKLKARLEDEVEELETADRIRLETAAKGIERRALIPLAAWQGMLQALRAAPPVPGERRTFVDWLALTRREGREVDAGLHRHWLDPTTPFALNVAAPAHGLLITSATLRDASLAEDQEAAWVAAEARTGASHLAMPAIRAAVASPFNYAANTRAFVVTDVDKARSGQVAAAMQALFQASGGGGLGLFTAIRRLRDSFRHMAPNLEASGIPLYAQHMDAMDNATLVDVFRAEENSCLLGTDAMRDGVDVPGRSLRLLVFDRVPWPRPSILHRERRIHLSGGDPKGYDDALARHRLRQAFGRLIRRADDKGVFVLLDRSCPSRLLAGLPEGVSIRRTGLAEVVAETRSFLAEG